MWHQKIMAIVFQLIFAIALTESFSIEVAGAETIRQGLAQPYIEIMEKARIVEKKLEICAQCLEKRNEFLALTIEKLELQIAKSLKDEHDLNEVLNKQDAEFLRVQSIYLSRQQDVQVHAAEIEVLNSRLEQIKIDYLECQKNWGPLNFVCDLSDQITAIPQQKENIDRSLNSSSERLGEAQQDMSNSQVQLDHLKRSLDELKSKRQAALSLSETSMREVKQLKKHLSELRIIGLENTTLFNELVFEINDADTRNTEKFPPPNNSKLSRAIALLDAVIKKSEIGLSEGYAFIPQEWQAECQFK
jgi:chromosome segregation ATPase